MKKTLSAVTNIVLIILAVVTVFTAFQVVYGDVRFVRVISNSMAPVFHRSDTLIMREQSASQVRVGDIVMLPLQDGSGGYYTHRITAKKLNQMGQPVVHTQGDANPIPDDWELAIISPTVPVYVGLIPTASLPFLQPSHLMEAILLFSLILLAGSLLVPARKERKLE